MLSESNVVILLSLSVMLINSVTMSLPSWLKRLVFICSAVLVSIALSTSVVQVALGSALALGLGFIEKPNYETLIRKFMLIVLVMAGNWMGPTISEFVLLLLMVGLFLRSRAPSSIGASLVTLWALTLVVHIVSMTGAFSTGNLNLLASALLVAATLATVWPEARQFTSINVVALSVLIFAVRILLENQIGSLSTNQLSVFSLIFQISFFVTTIAILIRGYKRNNDIESFILLTCSSLMLPFTPDSLLSIRSGLDYNLIMLILGLVLISQMTKLSNMLDAGLKMLLGAVIIVLTALPMYETSFSRVTYLGFMLILAGQIYFIFKELGVQSMQTFAIARERLPQWFYLGVTFGGSACLWYILSYVRQV